MTSMNHELSVAVEFRIGLAGPEYEKRITYGRCVACRWLSGRALDLRFTVRGFNPGRYAFTQHRSTQPCIPPGSLNRLEYLLRLGVKAGFSPLSDGAGR